MKNRVMSLILAVVLSATAFCMPAFAGTWKSDSNGWWYQEDSGDYPKNTWRQVGTEWYHFDNNGYMQTGWYLEGKNWFFLMDSGAMLHDAKNVVIGGVAYSFNSDGVMITTKSALN